MFNEHMNPTLVSLELRAQIGPSDAARLLGVGRSTYAHYRSGLRDLPIYHIRHVEVLLLLPPATLADLTARHCDGHQENPAR